MNGCCCPPPHPPLSLTGARDRNDGNQSYSYDNNGSITSGGVTTTMVYDGDGGRVKKTVTNPQGQPAQTVRYIGKPQG